jgi:probable rRNA maturation factor
MGFTIFGNDMNKKSSVRFHFLINYSLQNRGLLKLFIGQMFKKENVRLEEVNIIFCDDRYLLNLNKQFLKHDFYTDILSFPLSKPKEPLVAEIYISLDRVRDNAFNEGNSIKEEIHRVLFHGVLHFCGYKDKSKRDIQLMRDMENKYLRAYFK